MSEVQATETDDKPDESVLLDQEVDQDEKPIEKVDADELEIVVEEEVKPTSRRLTGFEKRLRKKDGQIDQANAEAEALREENKLLRLAQQQKLEKLTIPVEDNFTSDEEYRSALRAYEDQRINDAVDSKVRESLSQSHQQTTQDNLSLKEQQAISEHYKRADNLKVKNYDDLEGKAIEILGEEFAKTLIANTDNAHLILPYLGANAGKAVEIASMIQSDPVRAFAKAVAVGSNPNLTRPKHSTAPDPETEIDPGSSISQTEKKLDDMRQKVAEGKATMDDLMKLKRKG